MNVIKYVNLYEVGECYGGAEEGGWWYPQGDFIKCHRALSVLVTLAPWSANWVRKTAVRVFSSRPQGEYRMGHGDHDGCDPAGEPDDSYILSGGVWGFTTVRAFVETVPGKDWVDRPGCTQRPHYE